jgi:acyl-coenzyme A thioesterase PaaI-like protein
LTGLPAALYEPIGGGFAPTALTRGPWNPEHQHAGPPAALLARAIEAASRIDGGQTGRLSFDILRPVPIAPLAVEARVLRPGRNVEQVAAELRPLDGGDVLMRATAWRLRTAESSPQTAEVAALPAGPETGRPGEFTFWTDDVAYKDALDWRFVEGVFERPGPATVWTRLLVPLVAGEEPTPLERLLAMADAASGVSAALDWSAWMFVNVDLGIHLVRPPAGKWLAMAARTDIGPTGMGLCTSTLFDAEGSVGVSTQTLLVGPR